MTKKSKIKLVFFDLEGTIFKKVYKDSKGKTAPSIWTLIAEHLGPDAFEEEEWTKEKWNSDQYSGYVEWMADTIRIHQKYGLKKEFFDKIISSVKYHKGVKETFAKLRKKGYETALITGGFKAQANRAQIDLKINHAFAACEYFWDKKGRLVHWNLLPCDYKGKLDFMKLIMKEHGLKRSECGFVGDGRNDIPFAKFAGMSVSFNGAPELEKASNHSIRQPDGKEDFRAILKYF